MTGTLATTIVLPPTATRLDRQQEITRCCAAAVGTPTVATCARLDATPATTRAAVTTFLVFGVGLALRQARDLLGFWVLNFCSPEKRIDFLKLDNIRLNGS